MSNLLYARQQTAARHTDEAGGINFNGFVRGVPLGGCVPTLAELRRCQDWWARHPQLADTERGRQTIALNARLIRDFYPEAAAQDDEEHVQAVGLPVEEIAVAVDEADEPLHAGIYED